MSDQDGAPSPDAEARVTALERQVYELRSAHQAALLRVGLRHEAQRAGMVDLDGLKLVDPASVTLDAQGELVGAAAMMTELRRAKPWLFGLGVGAATSSSHAAPPAQPAQVRRAPDMSHDEWQLARAALLRRS